MKTPRRSILLLILIFAAGSIAGAVLSRIHMRNLLSNSISGADSGFIHKINDRITDLELDETTEADVLAIFERARIKRLEARRDSMKRLRAIIIETQDELQATLSKEDYKRYRESIDPANPMIKAMLDRISEREDKAK